MAIAATELMSNYGGFAGDHRLYKLDRPLTDPASGIEHDYVVVFTTTFGTPETIIVPGSESGAAPSMTRLPGCQVGIADHAGALWAAGGFVHGEPYEIVSNA